MTASPTRTDTPERPRDDIPDVQAHRDVRNVPLDRVGVKNIRYPIRVRDRAHEMQHTVGTVDMSVDLPHHFKGAHMSRFLEVLGAFHDEIAVEGIPDLLASMQERLEADTAHFSVRFPYFVEKAAPVSGARGMMAFDCAFDASRTGDRDDFVLTVHVPVTTLCPCSKEISARGAHNQRGRVTVRTRFEGELWIEDLVEVVEDSASCPLYPVLKREDERYVTERAYDNPRFVEDLVRDVTLRLRADDRITWFTTEVVNFESIHDHDAYASREEGVLPGDPGRIGG